MAGGLQRTEVSEVPAWVSEDAELWGEARIHGDGSLIVVGCAGCGAELARDETPYTTDSVALDKALEWALFMRTSRRLVGTRCGCGAGPIAADARITTRIEIPDLEGV